MINNNIKEFAWEKKTVHLPSSQLLWVKTAPSWHMKQLTCTQMYYFSECKKNDNVTVVMQKSSSLSKFQIQFCRLHIAAFVTTPSCQTWHRLIFFFALRLFQLFIKNRSAPTGDTPEKQIVILPLTKMWKNGRQFPGEVAHMFLTEPLPLKSTANTSHPGVVSCPSSTGTGASLTFLKMGNASTTQL